MNGPKPATTPYAASSQSTTPYSQGPYQAYYPTTSQFQPGMNPVSAQTQYQAPASQSQLNAHTLPSQYGVTAPGAPTPAPTSQFGPSMTVPSQSMGSRSQLPAGYGVAAEGYVAPGGSAGSYGQAKQTSGMYGASYDASGSQAAMASGSVAGGSLSGGGRVPPNQVPSYAGAAAGGQPPPYPGGAHAGGQPPYSGQAGYPATTYGTQRAEPGHGPYPAGTSYPTGYPTGGAPALISAQPQPSASLVQVSASVFPNSQGVRGRANIPLGAVYTLMKEELPVVNPPTQKLIRCAKCRAYVNCYVEFRDGGSKWGCNICAHINDVPNDFYCSLLANGERQDKFEKPELSQAAVEFVATPDYMTRPPMAPAYVLLLDVSKPAVQSGFVHSVCQSFRKLIELDKFPGLERAQICIMTYDANIYFYTPGSEIPHVGMFPRNSTALRCTVGTGEVFLPSNDLLIHIKDNKDKLLHLLDNLNSYWTDQVSEESSVAGALTAAKLILRPVGGKILLCQSTLPLAPELGLNPSHDMRKKDSKGRSTTNHALPDPVDGVKPSSPFFSSLAAQLAQLQIAVDTFVAPALPVPMDVATIGQLARNTGGQVYYYPSFSGEVYLSKLAHDVDQAVAGVAGWEGVMRVRCTKTWKITKYHGNYCFRGVDLLMLPSFAKEHTVSVQFEPNESVTIEKECYVQAAVLYTTSAGERRIRVVNHCMATSPNLRDIATGVNVPATMYLVAHNAMDECYAGKLADGRGYIHSQAGHLVSLLSLITPLTPPTADPSYALDAGNAIQQATLFCAGLIKSTAFRDGRDVSADERVVAWNRLRSFTLAEVVSYVLPKLLEISQLPPQAGVMLDNGDCSLPGTYRLTNRVLNPQGAYLLANAEHLLLWLGRAVSSDWLRAVFGVNSTQEVHSYAWDNIPATTLPGQKLHNIVTYFRKQHCSYLPLIICKQGEPLEARFVQLLIEDKNHSMGAGFLELWDKFTKNAASRTQQYMRSG
ncbi:trunk domain protein [Gregarina niphandrodes]|uniref:Trunk domain protein n=1 Tax=Gregarina niphandrodes TaxID=110365 RepID=A0A023B500_GRENI|nr:trunk domain protein [Gregarina niphandrodes]EZG57885.1 trunk domain protein [Gregarina niphandrodes]|eukprot:XP_011131006.1 trunk domain protein [Gregarina niphandrodes]